MRDGSSGFLSQPDDSRRPQLAGTRRNWRFFRREDEMVDELVGRAIPGERIAHPGAVEGERGRAAGRQILVEHAGYALPHDVDGTGDWIGGDGQPAGDRLRHDQAIGLKAARKYENVGLVV